MLKMNDLVKYLTYAGIGLEEVFKLKGEKLILSQKETDVNLKGFSSESFYNINSLNRKFDLILGNLPLGLRKKEWIGSDGSDQIVERENWLYMLDSLSLLTDRGFGVYPIEPAFFESDFSKKFRNLILKQGFKIDIIINLPKTILQPESSLQPVMLIVSRGNQGKYFVAEIAYNPLETINSIVIKKIIENKYKNLSNTLKDGMYIDEFEGFNKYKIKKEIAFLEKEYTLFRKVFFKDIITDLVVGRSFVEKQNSLYISKSGKIYTCDEISQIKLNKSVSDYAWGSAYSDFARIDLNEDYCLAKYMTLFFKSKLGEKLLNYLKSGAILSQITFKKIPSLQIPLPELSFQKKIANLSKKMNLLIKKTAEFQNEVALNPFNYEKLEPNLNQILGYLDMLSEEDRIYEIIKNGEDRQTEFKSTLRKSIDNEKIPDKVIEKNVLKTIAGFLNSEGGCLIIGVNDKQQLIGLSPDGFESNDNILKHLKNLITRDIDIKFIDLIKYQIISVHNNDVLVITCQASNSPVFLGKEEEFYVRTNPATDKLTGKKVYEYIQSHFFRNDKETN